MEVDDGHGSHVDRRRVLSDFDLGSDGTSDLGTSSRDKGKGRAEDFDFDVKSFASTSTSRLLPGDDRTETASIVMSDDGGTISQSQFEYNEDTESDYDDHLHETMVIRTKDKGNEVTSSSSLIEPNMLDTQVSNPGDSTNIGDDDDGDVIFPDAEDDDWDIEHDFGDSSEPSDDEAILI